MTSEKLKEHKSPAFDQISEKWIKAERRKIQSEIHKLIKILWKKKDLLEEWMESIFVPIYQTGDKTNCSNYRAHKFANYAQTFI